MAEKVKVRLTIRPDEEIEVDADEVPVLRHDGLLVEDSKPKADDQATEYEAARKRAADERAAAAAATPKTGRGQKDGE